MAEPSRRQRWDQRHAAAQAPNPVAAVLQENRHLLPASGNAVELACGTAGNALELARAGLRTQAWDFSATALEKAAQFAKAEGLFLETRQCDLTRTALPSSAFDVILVSHFLERDLFAAIANALRPGGLLFYQTFTQSGGSRAPYNAAFRLNPDELLHGFPTLQPLVYRDEGNCGDTTRGLRGEAYLVARRP